MWFIYTIEFCATIMVDDIRTSAEKYMFMCVAYMACVCVCGGGWELKYKGIMIKKEETLQGVEGLIEYVTLKHN